MTTKATTNTVTYGTDSYRTAIEKIYTELDALWARVNILHRAQASEGTEPSDNTTGDLWMDLNPALAAPILKYYDGANFTQVGANALFDSGLYLNDGMRGYTKNAFLTAGSTTVSITSTSNDPVTVMIGDNMLQHTSTPTVTFTGGGTDPAGKYAIYADRDASTTTFTLKKASFGSHTDDSTERTLGYVYWNGTNGFPVVVSYESWKHLEDTRPMFHVYRNSTTFTATSESTIATVEYNASVYDPESLVASGVFTAPKTGKYYFKATGYMAWGAGPPTWAQIDMSLVKTSGVTSTTVARNIASNRPGSGSSVYGNAEVPFVEMTTGDTMKVSFTQTNSDSDSRNIGSSNSYFNSFYGMYLGR